MDKEEDVFEKLLVILNSYNLVLINNNDNITISRVGDAVGVANI